MREHGHSPGGPVLHGDPTATATATQSDISGPYPLSRTIGYAEAAIVVLALVGVSILALMPNGPLGAGRDWMFDTYQILCPSQRASPQTVVVEIDEASIRRIGPWPWSRDRLAALIEAAGDARAIGLDLLLPDADRLAPTRLADELKIDEPSLRQTLHRLPDPDATLAEALRAAPSVLALAAEDDDTAEKRGAGAANPPVALMAVREHGDGIPAALPRAGGAEWPFGVLAAAAHGIGVISAMHRRSGEIDRLPAAVTVRGSILPGFALRLAAIALKAETLVMNAGVAGLSSVSLGGLEIPTDSAGQIRPRFVGPGRIGRIPAYALLQPADPADAARLRAALRNRIVVIGVTAPGADQPFAIPLGIQESSAAIQAELVDSVIAADTLWRPPWAALAELLVAATGSLCVALLLGRIRYRLYVLMFAALLLLPPAASIALFRAKGLLLDCVVPLTCIVVTGFATIGLRIGHEIAARRRREAELAMALVRQSAERREAALLSEADSLRQSLAFAVDAASLGVWDADLRRGAWQHSPRHDVILGLTARPARWTQDILLDRVIPEDLAAVKAHFAAAERSGTLEFECGIRWPDASLHYVHVFGRFWYDSNGTPIRSAGVIADVTPQRELEYRLRQSEKMQTIGLLAGGIAHNFNNLLTVVLGSLELAQNRLEASPRAAPLIANAINASRKCAEIARQLLAFARLQPLRPKAADPVSLLRSVHQMLRTAVPVRIDLQLEIPDTLPAITIDAVEFELALLNLAINARDAMPNGGHLTITACNRSMHDEKLGLDGHYLLVEVTDTGHGIAPDKLNRVFEPFFTTKEVGQGTGLGLSQVHGFAHQSGGAVDIDSVPNQGTTVRLYLPSSPKTTRPLQSIGMETS